MNRFLSFAFLRNSARGKITELNSRPSFLPTGRKIPETLRKLTSPIRKISISLSAVSEPAATEAEEPVAESEETDKED